MKTARRNLNLFSLSTALAVLHTVGLSFSFMPNMIPHSIRRRGYHRTLQSAGVAGGGMDELQNHSLQTMNLVRRGNAIGSTGFAAVAPRLKALLYGVAERVEQKPLLHICHHMNGTALWRFEHMPLVVVSE